ncbi:osmotic avoidance abnormal protein 3-like isoform X2 [Homalodisca vitripennis]|uniref:osmotic avoidance abnormal protein 3-like isoform X2 n=1 Tax=Homalodisca vitripennis TaxID=197043 RepID=UPI001EEBF6E6|nr:osmotic avoidance abnormal protein 3-like isoform X2 [Homalodisca vitripennis]
MTDKLSTYKTPISIYCRIKPQIEDSLQEIQDYEINRGSVKDILVVASQQNTAIAVTHKPESYYFHFSRVFDQDSSQELIYNSVAKPVVHSTLKGYNGTIFAYGQTGSGKTFTISGDKDNQGIVPRALQDIFTHISTIENEKFEVQMSYLEIYNENSNDLLMPNFDEKKKICLRENCDKVMEWHNLSVRHVATFSEAMEWVAIGDNHRIVCDTPMNVFSSRSHTILTIYLTSHIEDSLEVRKAKLNLVDLAGSERVHKTGEEGIVLEEARHINLSLHYLEQVIVALSESNRTHVPYRNCTMTSALRDSLGGNCMTVMIANIAINKANFEETVSTCRFAQRVALVRNEVSVNTEKDLKGENSHLRDEIQQLRIQCLSLQAKVQELEQKSACEEWLASVHSGEVANLRENIKPTPSHTGGLSVQQLQTDIIHLIEWFQDELKHKNGNLPSLSCDTVLSSYSTVEPDEGFEHFVTTVEAEDDWNKAKEAEQNAADALMTNVKLINSVHDEMLHWWKHNEKSLVRELLSGRTLNILGSESLTDLSLPESDTSVSCVSLNDLLAKHSDLLKDFQLLKSRLQSSKRSLQRIKRKYMVEYNNWKKDEKSSEFLFEILDDGGNDDSLKGSEDNNKLKYSNKTECKISEVENTSSNLNYEKGISNYKNNILKDVMYNNSMLGDLNSTFGDINDSVFSTSTLLSDTREDLTKSYSPRLVRSVPDSLGSASSQFRSRYTCTERWEPQQWGRPLSRGDCLSSTTPFHLTGDQDIDDEIIAFYKNKRITD